MASTGERAVRAMGRYRGRHAAAKYTEFNGARLRKGVSTAAVAAAAMAALTASQAPGLDNTVRPSADDDGARTDPHGGTQPGDDSYHTELPPLESPAPEDGGKPDTGPAESGIPATVLAAYHKAEDSLAGSDPGCALPWELLAAIGKVESGQARGGAVDAEGTTLKPILGPVLNGRGFANIQDTDSGVYDGDTRYDRAVGPMQFIPSTWADWGADGNGDGRQDPNNIFDAALAAGEYLCAGDRDLSVKSDLDQAILSYNRSTDYLRTVLSWLEFYREGVHEVPDGEGVLPTSPGPSDDRRDGAGDDPGRDRDRGKKPEGGDKSPGQPKDDASPDEPSTDPTPTDPTPTDPTPDPDPTDPDPTDPAPDPTVPAAVERIGDGEAVTTAGTDFEERFAVRVTSAHDQPVSGAEVRFTVVGDTDARFQDGGTGVTVETGDDGRATAPVLTAGEQTGSFTVRAAVVGRELPHTDFRATVEAAPDPEADKLTRTSDAAMSCTAGEVFVHQVQVKATHQDEAAGGVAVRAALLTADGKALPENTGPAFRQADGTRPTTLEGLRTDADGLLMLPKIAAGEQPGTYLLRLTAAGGGVLTVELKVTAAS